MSLNLKNEETNRLAHELAVLTGETLTTAVTVAVRERLERLQQSKRGALSDRLLRIGKDCAAHLREPFLSVDHGDCSTTREVYQNDRGHLRIDSHSAG
jgi:antitoxin VapB